MAEGQEDDSPIDDAERERLTKKLDGYEAMGLDVVDLRRLLEDDPGEFKATYLAAIRAQLEGGTEEVPHEGPTEEPPEETAFGEPPGEEGEPETTEEEPTPAYVMEREPGPEETEKPSEEMSEDIAEEEAGEELELELEGAGPEEALAETGIPGAPEGEGEPAPEGEVEGGPGPGEVHGPEEGPEAETPEEGEVEISIEAEEALEEPGVEEEAEIEVGEAAGEPEEAPTEGDEPEVEEEEALIVVAEVVEEEPGPEEDETQVRLAGLTAAERKVEPAEEPPAEEPEETPVRPRPVKRVVPKRAVAGVEPSREVPPKERPPKRAPAKRAAARKESPEKEPAKKVVPKRRVPPATTKRRRIPTTIVVVLAAALVVSAGAMSYIFIIKNDPPTALFTFDPSEPIVGEVVTFDARDSFDADDGAIERYVWDFGDGVSGEGRVVKHTYIKAESFTIRLTIEDDGGARATLKRNVTVVPLQVSMARPNEGDYFQYDVTGNISISNPAGLFEFKGPTDQTEQVRKVEAEVKGTKDFEVVGTSTAVDGFMKPHDNARSERTHYDLDDIQGTLETSIALNPTFTGQADARITEDICQEWERAIRSEMEIDTEFSAMAAGQDWATLSTQDDGTFYAQLTGIERSFSLNELLRNTTFISDDTEENTLDIGSAKYIWKGRGMERVQGRDLASLHVNVTMDRSTLDANNLNAFFIDVWIEPGLSQPSKYHIHVGGREQGNTFRVDLTEVLSSVTLGTVEAHGLPCSADHAFSVVEFHESDFDQLEKVPEQGGTTGGFLFNPEQAYQEALTDGDFATYISTHPDAFLHIGNYSVSGGEGIWDLTFGQDGSPEHFFARARGGSSETIRIVDKDNYSDDTRPLSSVSGIGEVVTLSRGLRLLRAEPEIGQICFNGQEVDWSSYSFNITEGVSTLSLDPASVLIGAQETGYVYILESKTGPLRHRGALDATNGQVLFTWNHLETRDFPAIEI